VLPTVQTPEGFHSLSSETIRFSLDLAGAEQIADLLAMTPHLVPRQRRGAAAKAAALTR
jgi:23S rRNA (guanine745-N1)-methyltransferase